MMNPKNVGVYDRDRERHAFHSDSYWGGERYYNPSCTTLGTAQLFGWRALGAGEDMGAGGDGATGGASQAYDGYTRVTLGSVGSYLVPHSGETMESFQRRHQLAAYVNLVAPIVDAYSDAATSKVTRELGPLACKLENLNGRGRTWAQHMGEVARWTEIYGFTATILEPPAMNPAFSQAEEIARKIGLRATLIHAPAIAWVEVDRDGTIIEFAYVDQPYASREAATGTRQNVSLYVYDREGWRMYETSLDMTIGLSSQRDASMKDKTPKAQGAYKVKGKVPVFFAFFREDTSSRWPVGISLIADTATMARRVYNTLSSIGEIHDKTGFPFLAIPTGATSGSLEPETKTTIGPDKAFGYQADAGAPSWIQPSAEQTRELREQVIFEIGLAFRLAGLEASVEGSGGTDSQSGLAIQLKSRGFEARCARFAENLEGFERGALSYAEEVLETGEVASVAYPKRFVLPDASEDMARALLLLKDLASELPPAAREAAVRQALNSALTLSEAELARLMEQYRMLHAAEALKEMPATGIRAAAEGGALKEPEPQPEALAAGAAAPDAPAAGTGLAALVAPAQPPPAPGAGFGPPNV